MDKRGTTYTSASAEALIRRLLQSLPCHLFIMCLIAAPVRSAPVTEGPVSDALPAAIPQEETIPDRPAGQETAGPDAAAPESMPTGTNGVATATTGTAGPDATSSESPDALSGSDTFVDVLHASISRGIQGSAIWMDSFFGDRRHDIESNRSFIRFRYNIFVEKDSRMIRRPDLQVRAVLPQMRERTHLVLSGSPRQGSEFSALDSGSETDGVGDTEDRNASAAVEQTFFESARQNVSIRAGLKLHDNKPVAAIGPQYRVLFPMDGWNLRFIEEGTWTSDIGWEARSTIDLERELPRNLFFRASNEWIWKKEVDGYVYAFLFMLGQPISPRKALEYEWVNIFATEPVHTLNEVAFRARYRQRIWRDWFFFEVTPQYRFPRERSFKATPGVLFRLDVIFGDYPVL